MQHVTALLIALLACNTVYYILAGRFSEALESVAWYALLILFLLEMSRRWRTVAISVMRGIRVLATLAIVATLVLYVREQEWLDGTNLALWIAVVVLLEWEVRAPAMVAAHRVAFARTALCLYGSLAVLVGVWALRGKWMNAWDASLWLAAFALVEMRLLDAEK